MTPALPYVRVDRMDTGLDLRAVEMNTLPIVSIALLLPAGSNNDIACEAGLSQLTGSALDAGTPSSDIHALAERIEFLGASLHVNVMHDVASITLSTLTRHLDDAMAILGEILCSAAYPQQEVDRLRQTQIASLVQMRDRPGLRASLALDHVLFGNEHSYGRPIMGMQSTVERLTAADTRRFFCERYRPNGVTAIAVGNISIESWKQLCRKHLGEWTGGRTDAPLQGQVRISHGRRFLLVDRPATPQAEIRMGCIAMPRNHPDYGAATVLNRTLGGQFTSRINTSLREQRGLTYGAWSAFSALRSSGTFVQGGAFHTASADEAVRVLIDEVRKITADGISRQELEYAQRSMSGNFLRSFETPSQVCARLQAIYAYNLPDDYYHTYLQRLNAVTQEDILQVARRWLDPDRLAVVVVGDSSSLRAKLEQIQPGEVLLFDDA